MASHQHEEVPATARAALETLAAQVGSAIARVQAEEALRRAKDDLEIRVAARTAQLQQANECPGSRTPGPPRHGKIPAL